MLAFLCPVCGERLKIYDRSYKCKNAHSFDISKKGYVNLLVTNGRNPKLAGDNKEMIRARTRFLDTGAYYPLAKKTGELINELSGGSGEVIDSGCGEGYYTCIYADIAKGCNFYGIDISKHGIDHAASRARTSGRDNVSFAVSSAFKLPFKNESADIVVSTFAPVSNDEYARVLKKGGGLIVISPTQKHLWSLKKLLYDTPYLNEPNVYALNKFELCCTSRLEYTALINGSEDIKALFMMTPYYYKTSKEAAARLDELSTLETECGFEIRTYKRK